MEKIIVYTEPTSPIVEAYRVLCTNLLSGLQNKKLIEIASVSVNTDTSVVVANLATAIAQSGKQVLLIDCDLHNPKQHMLFELPNRGVTEYVSSSENYTNFVQETAQNNLWVFTAGATSLNPVEALLSSALQKLRIEVKEIYDIVLVIVPPACDVADAVALGTQTDGVLLVLTNKVDKVQQVQKAKEVFMQAGIPIVGCVLDRM